MTTSISSQAEQKAKEAQELHSFARFNLLGTKQGVEALLSHIGREGIFSQYTKHDISHIDTLLGMLDWVVASEATTAMTPVDWMLVVLAIYFHDAGLLVTKSEFDHREQSSFPKYREQVLGSKDASPYKERVESLEAGERERFLYQEFVRTHHAARIRCWIEGEANVELGVASDAASEVADLLKELDENFRRDLALICESHHKEDLDDIDKYNPHRAYGNDLRETANLQFGAILLRTVDLLHVTKDRAPSMSFRLIAPADPKSIEEWHKQMEVVSVRKSPPRDEKGNVDKDAIPDTIAVSATFRDPLGFFSLTEYLHYAEKELRRSHQWAEQSAIREASSFRFPWRRIDSSQVKAVGFESRQFSFELDKPKILKLLTGHTLYSNSDVVVRELVQNSLDATRLQSDLTQEQGRIVLTLNTASRLLTIDDNGTGMTQQILEEHFLNVGNSRYSDDAFRKQNPTFSAISRFGIGILSTFMISDEIEVITKDANEKQARNLSIRSLNGKYLIRLLDPDDSSIPTLLKHHGTRVQLRIRAGIQAPLLRQIAEFWILFPRCELTVKIDDASEVRVGYLSPKAALEATLVKAGYALSSAEPEEQTQAYRVVEDSRAGLSVAYALRWQPLYKNWEFASSQRIVMQQPGQSPLQPTAVCVHGIRVESTSPGFAGQEPLAISNIIGPESPATNVARSNLDTGTLVDEMFRKIYDIYAAHVTKEIRAMVKDRGVSSSKAASEGRYLCGFLQGALPTNQCPDALKILNDRLTSIPLLTLDKSDQRVLASVSELDKKDGFWTTESSAYSSAEDLMRRMPSGISLRKLTSLLNEEDMIPKGDLIGGYAESALVRELVLAEFEVDKIEILQTQRQANLHWRAHRNERIWKGVMPTGAEASQRVSQLLQQFGRQGGVNVQRFRSLVLQNSDELAISGFAGECGLKGAARSFIFRDNQIHDSLSKTLRAFEDGEIQAPDYTFVIIAINTLLSADIDSRDEIRIRLIDSVRHVMRQSLNVEIAFPPELRELVAHPPTLFDPLRGERFYGYGAFGPFNPTGID